MRAYTNGERLIRATEKAYHAIYKEQGFIPQEVAIERERRAEESARMELQQQEEAKAKELAEQSNEDIKGGGTSKDGNDSPYGGSTENIDEDKKTTARRKSADK